RRLPPGPRGPGRTVPAPGPHVRGGRIIPAGTRPGAAGTGTPIPRAPASRPQLKKIRAMSICGPAGRHRCDGSPILARSLEETMRFVCLGYMDETKWAEMSEDERSSFIADCLAYDDELKRGGHFVG